MLVQVPDFFDKFQCLAGACPHSCCTGWEVVLDEATAERYRAVSGDLGERLRAAMTTDDDGDVCFPLNGGRCPFLDGENLCEIHKQLGEEATSVTCREHPRFAEDYGFFREITLSASCPAANDLLLGSREPLRFYKIKTDEPGEKCSSFLDILLPMRRQLLAELTDRALPMEERLGNFLRLAVRFQAEVYGEEPGPLPTGVPCLPENALSFLAGLEILEPDWPAVLSAPSADGAVDEALLERIAVYFAFRYLLKAVNDGDLLTRAQWVALAVLLAKRLASVCGLGEGLRRISCEIEHSGENLDAVLTALAEGTLCILPG